MHFLTAEVHQNLSQVGNDSELFFQALLITRCQQWICKGGGRYAKEKLENSLVE